ncbi:MAG: YiiX family permuted papain-like enzyme [Saprospiraceae bacterium]
MSQFSRYIILLLFIPCMFQCKTDAPKHEIKQNQKPASQPEKSNSDIQNGDIIFQTSKSSQSEAIQLATHSPYSHMGLIYEEQGAFFVFEAVQPVKSTPLEAWIKRGENGHFVVKRLKNAETVLTSAVLKKMKAAGTRFLGKDYDRYFEWSDEKIYCSELVWKIYQEAAGIQIGKLEHLADFDLSSPAVKEKMRERYGSNVPMDELVISPAAMYHSDLLKTVIESN